ncbi:hypothetical protein SAMN02910298_00130 [Pseudobutyrivibrio sp. YE44]|uniref:hypothetical protein n=1 Tax=Pseudobutyrivibrio sp. YE44 TaxID=1520802 RepID=UPI000883B081|nr:hypothetical protein [Pseudobutyrivibrio sp. YE44]SDB05667.1 hypothetical protein SAMN02910298_00130 [Pseudobutyrivibrio sp. YE44]
MIKEENIIDLSDFAERDIKEEVAHIRESITSLEKLIEAKEKTLPDDTGNNMTRSIKASIREYIEEISLPIEQKCDVLEAKLNALQESVNQVKESQSIRGKLLVANLIGILLVLIANLYIIFYVGA